MQQISLDRRTVSLRAVIALTLILIFGVLVKALCAEHSNPDNAKDHRPPATRQVSPSTNFIPSESITADQAVAFPVDI